ncbi:type III secretion system ATPase SctN [Serratia quinivorans]|uniref:type III secretion system ATPase SctN n=1 Tax=Serratia quinivorans TaxID=137545 RepID=UPI0021BD9066|nr:type III secretion system ATPase SctN [Serratia quinivorans]
MKFFEYNAHPCRIHGALIEAPLRGVFIGEICTIQRSLLEPEKVGKAQVVGFNGGNTILSLLGTTSGLSLDAVLVPTGEAYRFPMGSHLLGKVFNASGEAIVTLTPSLPKGESDDDVEWRGIENPPPDIRSRRPIDTLFCTGIRAIDGVLSCGKGQRMGIFASAGAGKTSLMNMLIAHSDADIYIVALIGERGREVTEFIHELKSSPRSSSTILVYATSDQPSVERCNAALLATAMAEYFRDQGQHVVLFLDSMTRYARALRDVALAAGELPARRGYPASVFEQLPALLERPGCAGNGAITAFYTVLLESEDEPDPIGDEIRSIIDGHIYLNYKLAGRGHYPAIDILRSISRVFPQVTTSEHQRSASAMRDQLTRLEEIQLYLDLGEYQYGENLENDRALANKDATEQFLRQSMNQHSDLTQTLAQLDEIIS